MKAAIFVCLMSLMGCNQETPERVLLVKHGRPGPIECGRTGEHQETCIDAGGLIWICYWAGPAGSDAECVNTGKQEAER